MKTVGGLRRTRYRGRQRVQMHAYLVAAESRISLAHINLKLSNQTLSSTALYVGQLLQESEQVARQTGTALGRIPRLAAKVATPPLAQVPQFEG